MSQEDKGENGDGKGIPDETFEDLHKVKVRKVARIFRPERVLVTDDTPLSRLVTLLIEHKESNNIYVVDEQRRLKGIITFHELLKVIWAKFGLMDSDIFNHMEFVHYAYSTTADDIMAPAVSVTNDDTLYKAIKLMEQHKFKDIPVVDHDGHVIEELNDRELLAFGRKVLRRVKDRMQEEGIDTVK